MSKETHILVPNQYEFNKVEQKYRDLEHRLRYMERDPDQKAIQHKRTLAALEKAIEETNTNIQVGHLTRKGLQVKDLSMVSPS